MPDDYAGRAGYWAALDRPRAAFTLVFVPLTARVAAPYNLVGQIRDARHGAGAPVAFPDGTRRTPITGSCRATTPTRTASAPDGSARTGRSLARQAIGQFPAEPLRFAAIQGQPYRQEKGRA